MLFKSFIFISVSVNSLFLSQSLGWTRERARRGGPAEGVAEGGGAGEEASREAAGQSLSQVLFLPTSLGKAEQTFAHRV